MAERSELVLTREIEGTVCPECKADRDLVYPVDNPVDVRCAECYIKESRIEQYS